MTSICGNSISYFQYMDACKDQMTRGQGTEQVFGVYVVGRVRGPCCGTSSGLMLWNVVRAQNTLAGQEIGGT